MDPCASQYQPWRTATTQFTIEDDGLARAWSGRVWCNPPYGPHAEKFLKRMSEHGNGIAGYVVRLTNVTPEVRQPSLDLEAA